MEELDGDERDRTSKTPVDRDRRRVLELIGGGALGASAARVGYEITGYGTVTGTNLTEQQLGPIARRHLQPFPFALTLTDYRLLFDGESLELSDAAGDSLTTVSILDVEPDAAARLGAAYDLEGPFRELAMDLEAIGADDFAFEFSGYRTFFDRLREAQRRPFTVAALRGNWYRQPETAVVQQFAGVDPGEPAELVTGLAEGFREHAHFDLPRYIADSIQDHVLFDAVPLREYVREPTRFDALLEGSSGLYCWEYTLRSIEAFHAVAPHHQSTPVFGALVFDERHNHVYTGLGSVVREDGSLRIPMTFLDYSHSTMYDTYHLQWAFGEGVDAYNEGHRASSIHYWNVYGR